MSDPLEQIVTLLQPQAVLVSEIHGRGRWGIRFPGFGVTNFISVAEGGCWLQLEDDPPKPFRTGDFLFQPASGRFAFLSEPGAKTVLGDAAYKHAAGPVIALGGEAGPLTRLVGGYCTVDGPNAGLFAMLLPRALHVSVAGEGSSRLGALVGAIADEARAARQGRRMMLQRLVEILILEALRHPLDHAGAPPVAGGLIAALRHRGLSQALQALHGNVAGNWTVARLAQAAGMSRAAFSSAFGATVGMTPIAYLTGWRMALARAALIHEKLTLEEIAARTGYGSAGALSHAFLRNLGQTPSDFRRERSGAGRQAG